MGSTAPAPNFSSPPERHTFAGLLFDMDGTIIDSTEAIVKHWHTIAAELNTDPNVILETSHGRRSIDVLRVLEPSKANWEYVKDLEGKLPVLYGDSAVELPGARNLISALTTAEAPWAIVTSGTTPLVTGWLSVLSLPKPEHLVVAEDVEHGKPDPRCYLMGREKLGLLAEALEHHAEVLVLEDAPAGIKAGKAAGCKVLAVATSHTAEQVRDAGADWVVKDLDSVRFLEYGEKGVLLEISGALI